jgi:ABC-type glycerol-3-phosphate transport system substrate-binding protein
MLKRALTISSAVAVAVGIAACGGSKAPGVVLAPSGGSTQAAVATTPTVPADLSTKPTVTVPKSCSGTQLLKKDLITGTGQTVQPGKPGVRKGRQRVDDPA